MMSLIAAGSVSAMLAISDPSTGVRTFKTPPEMTSSLRPSSLKIFAWLTINSLSFWFCWGDVPNNRHRPVGSHRPYCTSARAGKRRPRISNAASTCQSHVRPARGAVFQHDPHIAGPVDWPGTGYFRFPAPRTRRLPPHRQPDYPNRCRQGRPVPLHSSRLAPRLRQPTENRRN
mgnify:CR=1 FL=1